MEREQDFVKPDVEEIAGDEGEESSEEPLEIQSRLVRTQIQDHEAAMRMSGQPAKMSTGDLIRLFQFQQELIGDEPAELIEVRWVTQKRDEEE